MTARQIDSDEGLPPVRLVPCADRGRAGCAIVRRAVALAAEGVPEIKVCTPEECKPNVKAFVVAVDSSQSCRALAGLREVGVKPAIVISASEVLAKAGLVKPGVDVRGETENLAQALAGAIRDSLKTVLEEVRERREYREQMAPILDRFQKIWDALDRLPSPNGTAEPKERKRVELLGKRSRNLFTKLDELVPPVQWAEPHDLFQDALLCIAFAAEGWVCDDADRWEQNMEKARVQIRPLLRRVAP